VKRLALLLGVLAALAAAAAASAHPLGNFTVNRFSGIELSGNRVYVKYVLDMAEIPAFQERQKITDERAYESGLARRIGRGLDLRVDGRTVVLRPLDQALAFPPGAAGLRTLRFEAVYSSPAVTAGRLDFRDTNFTGRIGWKEVVLAAGDGAGAASSSVPSSSVSHELAAYPKDLLSSPLEVTSATATVKPGDRPGTAPKLETRDRLSARAAVRDTGDDGFASLIAREHLSLGVILVSLALAFFWGSAHALSPGHGKAIVTAYLVGQRGKPRHAAALGLIVTATHTIGVFTLGFVTLALSQFIVPEQLYPWIGLVSGLLVIGVGASVLLARIRHRRAHSHGHHHRHHPRPRGARLALADRRRPLRRAPPLPVRARRAPRGHLAAPDRARAGADRRFQRGARTLDHGDRPRRDPRQAHVPPLRAPGATDRPAPGDQRPRHRHRRCSYDCTGTTESELTCSDSTTSSVRSRTARRSSS
jgi:nickel/cobalt transporter (NicO) family protein